MYCLIILYRVAHAELAVGGCAHDDMHSCLRCGTRTLLRAPQPMKPLPKFMCVKGIGALSGGARRRALGRGGYASTTWRLRNCYMCK